ncbi:MAG TPA: alpha/beta hydrolase [Puia sp.]|nr:alpha/beta hydrolase [Puia sp.]
MSPPAGHLIPYKSSQLHYYIWGTGSRLLFAFHGYGESADSFSFIGEALDPDHSLIAIDLPFHGRTDWKEGLLFTPRQLYEIMKEIVARHSAPGPAADPTTTRWGLIGYSMGGRIVLQLAENHPGSIDKLVLLAPDGLKVNSWYRVATRTAAGNLLFRWTMRRPGWLFLLLRLSHALHLVNQSIYKFAVHHIDDRTVRHDLYTRWTTMRKFRPHLEKLPGILRRRHIPVSLVYGKYDRIIRWRTGKKEFSNGGFGRSRLILLDTGHQLLRSQFLPDLLPLITG